MGPPLRTVITGPGTGVDPETTSRQVRAMMCGFQEVVPTWLKLKGTVFIVLRVRCIFHKMKRNYANSHIARQRDSEHEAQAECEQHRSDKQKFLHRRHVQSPVICS